MAVEGPGILPEFLPAELADVIDIDEFTGFPAGQGMSRIVIMHGTPPEGGNGLAALLQNGRFVQFWGVPAVIYKMLDGNGSVAWLPNPAMWQYFLKSDRFFTIARKIHPYHEVSDS